MMSRMKQSWVSRFCKQEKNTYFCEVDNDFITDAFNLYGINNDFHLYKQALSMILNETELAGNNGVCCVSLFPVAELDMDEVRETANVVYGMIHARFLVTNAGLEAMVLLLVLFHRSFQNTRPVLTEPARESTATTSTSFRLESRTFRT